MKYTVQGIEKKGFLARVAELAGQKMVFSGVPRCAYTLPGITLERDLTVITEDSADMELIGKLVEEGLLLMTEADADQEAQTETPTTETEATEEETEEAEEVGTREAEEEAEETVEAESEETAETEVEPEPETAETEEGEAETEESSGQQTEDDETLIPSISFPLSQHRAESICNLVFTVFSKGELLSKATGGKFDATQQLVDALKAKNHVTAKDALETITRVGAENLTGLTITDERVTFDGFPETDDADRIRAWTQLAAAINKTAIKQAHVQARKSDEPNEKFAFRTWLTRLGMNGPELKAERNLLYQNLSGHTAFRTQADAEKWKARYGSKRREATENGAEE